MTSENETGSLIEIVIQQTLEQAASMNYELEPPLINPSLETIYKTVDKIETKWKQLFSYNGTELFKHEYFRSKLKRKTISRHKKVRA